MEAVKEEPETKGPDPETAPVPKLEADNEVSKSLERSIARNLSRTDTFTAGVPINNISVNIQTNAPPPKFDHSSLGYHLPLNAISHPNYSSAADQTVKLDSPMTHTVTNVIVTQPMPEPPPAPPGPREWKTGLCSICDDVHIGCCTFFCFPCYACDLSRKMDESCCVPMCVSGWLIALRTKIRTKENIQGTMMKDCCVSFWCPLCALCQLAREVKHVHAAKD